MNSENQFHFKPLDRGLGFDKNANSANTTDRSLTPPTGRPEAKRFFIEKSSAKSSQKTVPEKLELEAKNEEPAKKPYSSSMSQDFLPKRPAPRPPSPIHFNSMNQGSQNSISRSLKKMLDSLPPTFDFKEDKRAKRHKNRTKDFHFSDPSINGSAYQSQKTIGLETLNQSPWARENNRGRLPGTANGLEQNNPPVFDVTLGNSLSKAFPTEESLKPFHHQMIEPVPRYREMSSNFASGIIDSMVLLALSSLFVISLVFITRVDVLAMLANSKMRIPTLFDLGLLYMGVTLLYYMLSRGLFGSTLGDWAFDVQLGSDKERNHHFYPFQVVFRTLVIMTTGVLTIPLVSLGFGKDIAYYFSGLKLYNRQY